MTALVFVLFDRLVARRQHIVKKRAVEAGPIVGSLFPASVRSRLYEEEQEKTCRRQESCSKTWQSNGNKDHGLQAVATGQDVQGNHIADQYENCTVVFSDLAGFTKW